MRYLKKFSWRRATSATVSAFALILFSAIALSFTSTQRAEAACPALSTAKGAVTMSFSAPVKADYTVWSRMKVPDTTNNSYFLEIDDTTCGVIVGDGGITANQWTWVRWKNGDVNAKIIVNLEAGAHTIRMIGRETGVDLDRVIMTSDPNCIPTGLGDNCASQNADTTPPSVSFTQPASNGTTVSGLVDFAVNATDDGTLSKVEFLVDGTLAHTEAVAPYEFLDWDSKTVANGTHTITAKATDAAGNTSSATRTVNVNNTNTNPPTPNPNPPTGGTGVSFVSAISNKCLDNNQGTLANENKVQLWTCVKGSTAQKWTVQSSDSSIRANGSNYCLDIKGGTTNAAPGTAVQLYTCNGTGAQKWVVDTTAKTIKNPDTGLCLDVKASSATDGTQIQIYTCNNSNAQKWSLSLVSARSDINEDGLIELDDFSILRNSLGKTGTAAGRADINGDGTVGLDDFSIWRTDFIASKQ